MILICHVGELDRRVVEALPSGSQISITEINPNDDGAYCTALELAWAVCANLEQPLTVIEHDIIIHGEVMPTFESCESLACAFPYWIGVGYTFGLGCTRFRPELIQQHPSLITDAANLTNDWSPPARHWKRMDTRIFEELTNRSIQCCQHMPPVEHFHEYETAAPHHNP